MLAQFDKVFRIDFRLKRNKTILIGVSGGPDSLFLLDLLKKCGYDVIVAHLDHQLRPQSASEARRVGGLAESLGVEFVLEECNVQKFAQEHGYSIEQAARAARYQFLFKQAEHYHAQAVAVGHNADDQSETVLMHFLQGSGLAGLSGMKKISVPNPWSETMPLIRPLLSTTREQILAYCHQNDLDPVFDPSNLETKYFRNRLRHELLPLLEDYVPGIPERLRKMADVIREDQKILDDVLISARNASLLGRGYGYVCFDALGFKYLQYGVQRRLVKWALSTLQSDLREFGFDAVERVLSVASSDGGKLDIALGLQAIREGNDFYLAIQDAKLPLFRWPQMPAGVDHYEFMVPSRIPLADGWVFSAGWVKVNRMLREQVQKNVDPFRAWLDVGEQGSRLIARIRRPGDRIKPFGMDGKSKKISDIMIDQKILERARSRWPLVCFMDEIIWVPGYRQALNTGVTSESSDAVQLQLIPPK